MPLTQADHAAFRQYLADHDLASQGIVPSLPERYRPKRLDEYRAETPSAIAALAAAERFVDGTLQTMVLIGPPGVGKSHLAAGIVNALWTTVLMTHVASDAPRLGFPHPPEWENVPSMLVGMRADMGREPEDREWAFRPGKLAVFQGTLVLDDLGREKVSDWTGETIYALVNERYEALRRTIVTSNLTADELKASGYWPAISRLAEDGELVRIEAPDHRLKKKAA